MKITISDEFREITIEQEGLETWTQAVELFCDALRGLGYMVKPFTYDGSEVYSDGDV